ncbi:hypothetical protein LTR62_007216 [Meristemomyces frigidus]|uniref:Cohesin loading factor n=1 Tax=Meristemomyces frigidus TaxID=1508187 RepID=A0AAN7TBR4_9PEZI|nr:hypothetical protein LTR62_007216 [Meristemomyces frigidus]
MQGHNYHGQQAPGLQPMYQMDATMYQPQARVQVVIPQPPRHAVSRSPLQAIAPAHVYQDQLHLVDQRTSQVTYEVPYPTTNLQYQQQPYPPQQYYQRHVPRQIPAQGYYQPDPPHTLPGTTHREQLRQQPLKPRQQTGSHRTPIISSTYQTCVASVPQQRTVAHVQIPVHRIPPDPYPGHMHRPAKRRRSDDAAALKHEIVPQKPCVVQAPPASSTLLEVGAPLPPAPAVDYQAVLLSLSDEYVSAAHDMSTSVAEGGFEDQDMEQYHHLISTALGCLQSCLQNFKHSDPRKEARIRLRFATLLFEETESSGVIEEVLSKGIALCGRNRLVDLKYAMHHLLVRLLGKSNVKAAINAVDKLIAEAEALKLTVWAYAFRFLRVSMNKLNPSDTAASLKNVASIQLMADHFRHPAVQIMAAAFETALHLNSGVPDTAELAQRALAIARMHQLSPEMQQLPQIRALLDCLDLACALAQCQPQQILEKMQHMHANMDSATRDKAWSKNATFVVPLGVPATDTVSADTAGIVVRTDSGEAALSFDWINRGQLYALGYLLSGVANSYKDSGGPDSKAAKFLVEGLKLVNLAPDKMSQPLSALISQQAWRTTMDITVRLQLICAQCAHTEWQAAKKALDDLQKAASIMLLDSFSTALLVYLDATRRHGTGELKSACALYGAQELSYENASRNESALKDLCIVATFNRILCLRGLDQAAQADDLLTSIEALCLAHRNKAITSAYYILRATTQSSQNVILKVKQSLQTSIQAAKAVSNSQLLCIVMNLMTGFFFSNIVGEQAVKSVRASRTLANKTHNMLWCAVADRMYGNTLELSGEAQEAQKARLEAANAMASLPASLQEVFAMSEGT